MHVPARAAKENAESLDAAFDRADQVVAHVMEQHPPGAGAPACGLALGLLASSPEELEAAIRLARMSFRCRS